MELLSDLEPLAAVAARGHALPEAPRAEEDGSLLYSDALGGGVYRAAASGAVEEVVPKRRGVGGLVPHRDGGVVVSGRTVAHVRDGETRELLSLEGVTGFNDMHADERGRVLAGALRFHPFEGEDPVPGEVWRIGAAGDAEVVGEGVRWPNGIGLSPDGERVYVSDYADGRVLAFDASSGDARAEVFAQSPRGSADGLAVDAEGGVWVALGDGRGVARFHADGRPDDIVDVAADFVSSLSFGGPDLRDVYVTTAGGILRGRSEVAGLPVPRAAV